MCGIVGYIGPNPPVPIIIQGLRCLEYRGYDSAGIAIAGAPDGKLQFRRAPGKLRNLEALVADDPLAGSFGIGHTRWATNGRPTEENAHPHRDCTGTLVVVHNPRPHSNHPAPSLTPQPAPPLPIFPEPAL
jgi:glucosamine--fructose-6-phosphate aminotransferase (isomerizing)